MTEWNRHLVTDWNRQLTEIETQWQTTDWNRHLMLDS